MYKHAILLVILLAPVIGFAQIDFDVLLDKKKFKKLEHHVYKYYKKATAIDCIDGDCENGHGIIRIKSGDYSNRIYAKGQFKEGKLNGKGAIYLFNNNDATRSFDLNSFDGKLRKDKEHFDIFAFPFTPKPDESFEGIFNNNIFLSGTYQYYGDYTFRHLQFTPISFPYLGNINPEGKTGERLYLYEYQGNFLHEAGKPISPSIEEDTDYIELSYRNNKTVIRKSPGQGNISCQSFDDKGRLLSSKIFETNEGRSEELSQADQIAQKEQEDKERRVLSAKFKRGMIVIDKDKNVLLFVHKVYEDGCLSLSSLSGSQSLYGTSKKCDINNISISPYKTICNTCLGKKGIERRMWVVSVYRTVSGRNGYNKQELADRFYLPYTPGGEVPSLHGPDGQSRKRSVQDVMIECPSCNGVGCLRK